MDREGKGRFMVPFGFGAADIFFILLAFFLIAYQPKTGAETTRLGVPIVARDVPGDTVTFSPWRVEIPKASGTGISDTIRLIYNKISGVDTFVVFQKEEPETLYCERIRKTFEALMEQVEDTTLGRGVDCFVWSRSYYYQVALVLKALNDLEYEPRLVYRIGAK
jgi:hypothetical protein